MKKVFEREFKKQVTYIEEAIRGENYNLASLKHQYLDGYINAAFDLNIINSEEYLTYQKIANYVYYIRGEK